MLVTSFDGTPIAVTRAGSGPPVVLVDGALCHRGVGPNRALAARLAGQHTVFTYDRRGRGESGDAMVSSTATASTAAHLDRVVVDRDVVDREIDDLVAVIEAAGGTAHLYGISSGGALALEVARRYPAKVTGVAVYEIPYVVDDSRPPVGHDFEDRLRGLVVAGRRGRAIRMFMREAVRLPGFLVAAMPLFPGWAANKAVAHTLPYDAAIMAGGQAGQPLPVDRWCSLTVPTMVIYGTKSPAWVHSGATALAQTLPSAGLQVLPGQTHYVKADALAPVLQEFFTGAAITDPLEPRRRQ